MEALFGTSKKKLNTLVSKLFGQIQDFGRGVHKSRGCVATSQLFT